MPKSKYITKEEAIAAVTKNGYDLEFCTPDLQNNEEVVMAVVKQNSLAFKYASKDLKSNKTFIMKALHEGVHPFGLIAFANISIQSDLEVITLALEKNHNGLVFIYVKGEAALNKDMAAKALVKWGNLNGLRQLSVWEKLVPALQDFFPKDCWHKKAQAYLIQLEQEKQAELVTGGSTEEDGVVW